MQSNIKWAADPRANLHLLKTRFGLGTYFYLCKLFDDLDPVV